MAQARLPIPRWRSPLASTRSTTLVEFPLGGTVATGDRQHRAFEIGGDESLQGPDSSADVCASWCSPATQLPGDERGGTFDRCPIQTPGTLADSGAVLSCDEFVVERTGRPAYALRERLTASPTVRHRR